MPVTYPVINGLRFDYSSIEIVVAGKRFPGFKSLNYKHNLAPGKVKGTAAQDLGRSRGVYSASGNVEVFREDSDDFLNLIQALQPTLGFMEINFDINVNYFELIQGGGPAAQNDRLIGCRITEDGNSNSQGSDPLTVKFQLDVMLLMKNGKFPIGIPQSIGVRG